jgi:membrane protease subunit (stomatin/prohibitin family)
MGLGDFLRGQLIDIIEWTEPPHNEALAYRFPRYANEIKMGAKLVVREGQNAVFVNEGQLADVYKPGTFTLETQNMPILATLKGWKYGFRSPFKAEVYFIAMRQWTDLKWGTQNPIMLRDPEFGPVRVRAFGSYSMHVSDPATFLRQLVATNPEFEKYEITGQLRNAIVSRIADAIGQAKIPVLDLAGNYEKAAQAAQLKLAPELAAMGLSLTSFYIENISLPPEVEKALDQRTSMGVLGNMQQFTQFQAAQALRDAAQNPGGIAGVGAGLGAGLQMANVMGGAFAQQQPQIASAAAPAPAMPPPLPQAVSFFIGLDGTQQGPFDLAALAAKAKVGLFSRATLVWRQGMAGWTAAESVPELQGLFASMPPPLPRG